LPNKRKRHSPLGSFWFTNSALAGGKLKSLNTKRWFEIAIWSVLMTLIIENQLTMKEKSQESIDPRSARLATSQGKMSCLSAMVRPRRRKAKGRRECDARPSRPPTNKFGAARVDRSKCRDLVRPRGDERQRNETNAAIHISCGQSEDWKKRKQTETNRRWFPAASTRT
jgi:hypothetical protein